MVLCISRLSPLGQGTHPLAPPPPPFFLSKCPVLRPPVPTHRTCPPRPSPTPPGAAFTVPCGGRQTPRKSRSGEPSGASLLCQDELLYPPSSGALCRPPAGARGAPRSAGQTPGTSLCPPSRDARPGDTGRSRPRCGPPRAASAARQVREAPRGRTARQGSGVHRYWRPVFHSQKSVHF